MPRAVRAAQASRTRDRRAAMHGTRRYARSFPPAGLRPACSEFSSVDGARAADLRGTVRLQLFAKIAIRGVVPDFRCAGDGSISEIDTIGCGHHAARHGASVITDIRTAPGPIALVARSGALLDWRQPQLHAEL